MICPGCASGLPHREDEDQQRRVLTSHFVERHLLNPARATKLAVILAQGRALPPEDLAAIGGVSVGPAVGTVVKSPGGGDARQAPRPSSGTDAAGPTRATPPPARAATLRPPDPPANGIVSPGLPTAPAVPQTKRGPCRHCIRLTPDRCKRHGGPSHRAQDKAKSVVRPVDAVRALVARLAALNTHVTTLTAARDAVAAELAAVREVLR